MKNRIILVSYFLLAICGNLFSQNHLANTTWETITDSSTRQTIVFGETGFRWTGDSWQTQFGNTMPGRNEVGTYSIHGEMVYLSIPGFTYNGIILGNTLNISAAGMVGWEFRKVQPNSSSQNNSNNQVTFNDVNTNPSLYQGTQITWRGMATNVNVSSSSTTFDFLVGYDTYRVLEGIVTVTFDKSISFNRDRPIEVLGRIVVDNSNVIRIEGISLRQ